MYRESDSDNVKYLQVLFMKDALGHGSNGGSGVGGPLNWQSTGSSISAHPTHGTYQVKTLSPGIHEASYTATGNYNGASLGRAGTMEEAKAMAEKHHSVRTGMLNSQRVGSSLGPPITPMRDQPDRKRL